jgi:hypothetical protein
MLRSDEWPAAYILSWPTQRTSVQNRQHVMQRVVFVMRANAMKTSQNRAYDVYIFSTCDTKLGQLDIDHQPSDNVAVPAGCNRSLYSHNLFVWTRIEHLLRCLRCEIIPQRKFNEFRAQQSIQHCGLLKRHQREVT